MDGCQPDITRSANTSSAVFLLKPKMVTRIKGKTYVKFLLRFKKQGEDYYGNAFALQCRCDIVWCDNCGVV